MATLRDIKRRITAVSNTAKITQAMKMISAAQLRRAQDAILSARPYVQKLGDVLTNLVENVGEGYSHPLIRMPKDIKNIVVIVIASDRGMCGSFNTNLFKFTNKTIHEDIKAEYPNAKINVVAVGKRSVNFFRKESFGIFDNFPGIFSRLKFQTAKDVVATVSDKFINGEVDKVYVIFNHFKNLISQVPTCMTLLPIAPEKKLHKHDTKNSFNLDYIFEPDKKQILDDLLPKHLDIQLWRTLLESSAAEQAARMVAMENATHNANELIKNLDLAYNKARQASITKEMLEIVGGAEALKK
jgi:F-type H+-transporting ATPase subunit gamma